MIRYLGCVWERASVWDVELGQGRERESTRSREIQRLGSELYIGLANFDQVAAPSPLPPAIPPALRVDDRNLITRQSTLSGAPPPCFVSPGPLWLGDGIIASSHAHLPEPEWAAPNQGPSHGRGWDWPESELRVTAPNLASSFPGKATGCPHAHHHRLC